MSDQPMNKQEWTLTSKSSDWKSFGEAVDAYLEAFPKLVQQINSGEPLEMLPPVPVRPEVIKEAL
jgi:hypothetical protein